MLLRWSHYAVWVSSKRRSSVSLCLMRCLMNMLYSPTNSHVPCSERFLRPSLSVAVSPAMSMSINFAKTVAPHWPKQRRRPRPASGFALSPDQCEPAGWASLISRCGPYVFRSTPSVRSLSLVSERGISPWEKPIGRAGICARLGHQIWRMRANDRGMDK